MAVKKLGTAAVLMADLAEFNRRKAEQKKMRAKAKREFDRAQRDAKRANEKRYNEITDLYEQRRKDVTGRYDESIKQLDEVERAGLEDIERGRQNQVSEVDARSISSGMYGVVGGVHDSARRRAGEDAQRASLRVRSEVGSMRSAAQQRYGDMIASLDQDLAGFKERRTDDYPSFEDYYQSIGGAAEAENLNDFRSFSSLAGQYASGGGGGAPAGGGGGDSPGGAQSPPPGEPGGDYLTGTGPKRKNSGLTHEQWMERYSGASIRRRQQEARRRKNGPEQHGPPVWSY